MAFGRGNDFGEIGNIAGHAEDAVEDDQASRLFGHALEAIIQRGGRIVAERNKPCGRELASIDNARVVLAVAEDGIPLLGERDEGALVGKKTCGEQNGVLTTEKFGDSRFQLDMELDRAVEQARAGASSPVAARGFASGLDDSRILREAEVVIRPDHDFALAFADHIVAVGLLDRTEIRVESLGARIGAVPVFSAFLEEVSRSVGHQINRKDLHLRKRSKSFFELLGVGVVFSF